MEELIEEEEETSANVVFKLSNIFFRSLGVTSGSRA
jgi:hypothetical protein